MSDSAPPVPDSATVLARAGRVLVDSGDDEAARLLTRLGFALEPEPESWSLSGRTVLAWRGVLLCPADLILLLRADAALRERLRASLAAAFDTRERTLRELLVLLDDASMPSAPDDAPAGHPYRDARGTPYRIRRCCWPPRVTAFDHGGTRRPMPCSAARASTSSRSPPTRAGTPRIA